MLFAMIGIGGYIAPKHLEAIKETGHTLDCSFDIHDSVGILDNYFPESEFFTSLEELESYLERSKNEGKEVNYLSVCTPNHTHFDYIRFGLQHGLNVICEKPLVLDPSEIQDLKDLEKKYQKKVFSILQLRLHPSVMMLKEKIKQELEKNPNKVFDITLTYITVRGKWYFSSWKADIDRSGGLATNVGVHIFDALLYLFGDVLDNTLDMEQPDCAGGVLTLEHAKIKWFLSINLEHMGVANQKVYRNMVMEGEEIDLTHGFDDLHIKSYRHIFFEGGYGLDDATPSIQLTYNMRNLSLSNPHEDCHPLCAKCLRV
ncbi:Gfo/Idh/MocA family protein [Helicobacter cetorum]|uniref:Gfo/Idh/MocA family protein n=1 Tax=Helicobacter cetorum TaxID=138563 RepID=UPI000CF0EF1D|nr:Gfo/Idh/MocA family oxidoreductase [Helicobacter cetorum]